MNALSAWHATMGAMDVDELDEWRGRIEILLRRDPGLAAWVLEPVRERWGYGAEDLTDEQREAFDRGVLDALILGINEPREGTGVSGVVGRNARAYEDGQRCVRDYALELLRGQMPRGMFPD